MIKCFIKFSVLFLLMSLVVSCSSDEVAQVDISNATVWSGAPLTFTKENNTDAQLAENQDKITDNVIITRGTTGGQIFNIAQETVYDKTDSPVGTLWAEGTSADKDNLEFKKFREAVVSPQNVVGKDLVLYLPEANVVIDVKFNSWASQNRGGFSYTRSTE